MAQFIIKDTVRDIAMEDHEKIFEPFEYIESRDNISVPGTGLGLAISHLLAELMGAKLSCNPVVTQGAILP